VVAALKESGYTVKEACAALGISRSGYYSFLRAGFKGSGDNSFRDRDLLERIKALKADHPFWGYRRVWAWLRYREKLLINQKRVRRVMKEHGLMVKRVVCRVKRMSPRSKPRADRPGQFWGIDMTKSLVPSIGWVYLVVVLYWFTKKSVRLDSEIVGWDLSLKSKAADWKRALEMAFEREFPHGVRGAGLKLISDNGSQPTSTTFMRDMAVLGIEQIFTSYDNPKGNADTERVLRTIKEELIWLNEFSSLKEAREKIGQWIEVDYNKFYVHSGLGYLSPEEYEALYNQKALMVAALNLYTFEA